MVKPDFTAELGGEVLVHFFVGFVCVQAIEEHEILLLVLAFERLF